MTAETASGSSDAKHRLEVRSDGPGSIVVRWRVATEEPVRVAVGATPEPGEHRLVAEERAADGTLRIRDLGVGRHYVSLRHGAKTIVAAERRLPFSAPSNFRDLGGYPTMRGGLTRWGTVFRSDNPHVLGPEDAVVFHTLGIRTIYDFRRDDERAQDAAPLPCVRLAVPSRRVADVDPGALRTRADGERWLLEDCLGMLRHGPAVFGRLFNALSERDAGPVLFHCVGGKDRTGMASALLLSLLGVPRPVVLDDYELTASFHTEETRDTAAALFAPHGITREAALGMLGTPRWVMTRAPDVLDAEHGGVERHLVQRGGMVRADIDALCARLVC